MKAKLVKNIEIFRDALVFFTACGSASGYGGHTGGAFDTAPEVVILDAMFRGWCAAALPALTLALHS